MSYETNISSTYEYVVLVSGHWVTNVTTRDEKNVISENFVFGSKIGSSDQSSKRKNILRVSPLKSPTCFKWLLVVFKSKLLLMIVFIGQTLC